MGRRLAEASPNGVPGRAPQLTTQVTVRMALCHKQLAPSISDPELWAPRMVEYLQTPPPPSTDNTDPSLPQPPGTRSEFALVCDAVLQ